MKIEISNRYIQWVKNRIAASRDIGKDEVTPKQIKAHINETLNLHRKSWDELENE